MKINKKTFLIVLFFLIVFFLRVWISSFKFNRDFFNHLNWVKSILQQGFTGFYQRDFSPWAQANYPPAANLLFWLSHKFFLFLGFTAEKTSMLATFYKLPVLIADIVIAAVLYQATKGTFKKKFLVVGLFLFNLGLIYNSVFWGQLENIVGLFCLLSLVYFFQTKKSFAAFFYGLGLLTKQSATAFLPVFLILLHKKNSLRKVLKAVLIIFLLFIVFFSLFAEDNFLLFPWRFYYQILQGQPHQYLASVNGFNFWFLVGQNKVLDSSLFLGMSYRWLGLIIVGILIAPLLFSLWKKPAEKRAFYVSALVFYISFLFLTRMHERHFYSALIFLLPVLNSLLDFLGYVIVSIIYFLNMHFVWMEKMADPQQLTILQGRVMAGIILVVFCYYYISYFVKIYKDKC
jgi:Gpi18-like mannosyltransferase